VEYVFRHAKGSSKVHWFAPLSVFFPAVKYGIIKLELVKTVPTHRPSCGIQFFKTVVMPSPVGGDENMV
jgi:hypothetical protein